MPEPSWPRVVDRRSVFSGGLSRSLVDKRVARGRWARILPGIYLTVPGPVTYRDRLAAALLAGGPAALITGAAALGESDIRIARPSVVTVLVAAERRVSPVPWLRTRRVRDLPRPMPWLGIRRAAPERALVDYALDGAGLDELRTMLARVVRSSWCTADDVAAELERAPRNGSARLRQALREIGSGAASAPEAEAARLLRRGRVTGFEQNARIDLPDGSYCIADFLWRDCRAVLEIDSVEHHLDPADWRATMDRHLRLEMSGYSVVHRPPSALRDPEAFVRDIRAWLVGRRRSLRW